MIGGSESVLIAAEAIQTEERVLDDRPHLYSRTRHLNGKIGRQRVTEVGYLRQDGQKCSIDEA